MCIIETCFNANLFPGKNYENRVFTIFNIKVCPPPPPGPSKSLRLFLLIWYIDTTYVGGKLGPGGEHTSKLKMVKTLFFKYLTGNKSALIDISMIHVCNKIKIKDS